MTAPDGMPDYTDHSPVCRAARLLGQDGPPHKMLCTDPGCACICHRRNQ